MPTPDEAWAELRRLTVACQSTDPMHSCSWCNERFYKIRQAVGALREPELIRAEREEAERIRKIIANTPVRRLPPRRPQ